MQASERGAHDGRGSARRAAVLAVLALLGACKGKPSAAEAPAKLVPMRIAYTTSDGVVPWGIVGQIFERTDLLARFGIDVTLVTTPDSPNLGWAIVKREVDAALVTTGVMGMALASGRPYDLVAAPGGGGRIALLVRADSDIKTVADLKGKTIENPILGGLLDRFLDTANLTSRDVRVLPRYRYHGEAQDDLLNGKIDALMHWDPYVETFLASKRARILIEDPYHLQIMLDRQFSEAHPDASVKFLMAVREALHYMLEHPEETSRWYAEVSGVPYADVIASLPHAELYQEAKGKGLDAVNLVPNEKKIEDIKGVTGAMGRYGVFRHLALSYQQAKIPGFHPEPKDAIDVTQYMKFDLAVEAQRIAKGRAAQPLVVSGPHPGRNRPFLHLPAPPKL